MRALIVSLVLIPVLIGCRSTSSPRDTGAPAFTAAVQGRERAAYTAYALALCDLHLSFLESLPPGWFIGTPEFDEGMREIERITGTEMQYDPRTSNHAVLFADVQVCQAWAREHEPQLSGAERAHFADLFGRLLGATPLLISEEFRHVVRSVESMTGLPASWSGAEGEELYANWAAFEEDLRAWRRWFDTNRSRLEWDVGAHRLRIGRGLGPSQ